MKIPSFPFKEDFKCQLVLAPNSGIFTCVPGVTGTLNLALYVTPGSLSTNRRVVLASAAWEPADHQIGYMLIKNYQVFLCEKIPKSSSLRSQGLQTSQPLPLVTEKQKGRTVDFLSLFLSPKQKKNLTCVFLKALSSLEPTLFVCFLPNPSPSLSFNSTAGVLSCLSFRPHASRAKSHLIPQPQCLPQWLCGLREEPTKHLPHTVGSCLHLPPVLPLLFLSYWGLSLGPCT